jgi:hypothetical protein
MIIGADHRDRRLVGGPAVRLQHPPVVRQLDEVRLPAGDPQVEPGDQLPVLRPGLDQLGHRELGRWLVRRLRLGRRTFGRAA